jgi:hypothetical protein
MHNQYRYTFSSELDITDVEATVTLALLATESLHGESKVRLEAKHSFDAGQRICVIDSASEVGRDFNQLFLGFISREFGPATFRVERVEDAALAAAG